MAPLDRSQTAATTTAASRIGGFSHHSACRAGIRIRHQRSDRSASDHQADASAPPRAYNDRLLLGLKGTMSEAEIHIMKQRLIEAMHSKARRGELCFRLPPGYEWDEAGRMVKTADEQVRSAIELMFARFEQSGTIHRVQSSMSEDGLQVPIVSGPRQRLRWGRPDYAHLRRILTHPIYAGAYCYGRRQVEQFLDTNQRPEKRIREQPRQQWHVLIREHHEPYVSWERFERIQRQIESERTRPRKCSALMRSRPGIGRFHATKTTFVAITISPYSDAGD
jgi:hypothetical protein